MRAGAMDRTLRFERETTTIDDYGTPVKTWALLMPVRAELVRNAVVDTLSAAGSATETTLRFRTWFHESLRSPIAQSMTAQRFGSCI